MIARYSLEDVKRTLRKHEKRLLEHPNVMYLGIGEKIRRGTGTSRLAIRVFVKKKQGNDTSGALPTRLRAVKSDGSLADYFIPTDVQEAHPCLKTLSIKGGDTIHGSTIGSVGLVFQGNNGLSYILTNAHVALAINDSANNQSVYDSNGRIIASVYRATTLTSQAGYLHAADAAVAVPSVNTEPFVIDGLPSKVIGYSHINDYSGLTNREFFYQRRNGDRLVFHKPNWIATSRNVEVDGYVLEFIRFFELSRIRGPYPMPGDSGSVVLSDTGDGLVAHGLLFSGVGDTIGVIDIYDVFTSLATA